MKKPVCVLHLILKITISIEKQAIFVADYWLDYDFGLLSKIALEYD